MGTRVTATSREAAREKLTVMANCLKIVDVKPWTNTIGRNTAKVVKVDAIRGTLTSEAPLTAESSREYPSCR